MPIPHDFEYFRPGNVREALRLLSKYKKAGILAGGTDIVNEMKEGISKPEALIDIKDLESLKRIQFKNGKLLIGALVTFSDLIGSDLVRKRFPVIVEVSRTVGSVGIRNRATMVGNICSAVPCMDSGPLLSVYEASVIVQGPRGRRRIPTSDWFRDSRKTALRKGEIVTGISIDLPGKSHAGCFAKLGRYSGEDLAQASVLVMALPRKDFRVAFGSVAPIPVRARNIENLLNGKAPDDRLINQAKMLIPEVISPITDIRATKEYRMHMCKVMFERALKVAIRRLEGNGPEYGISVI